MTNSFLINITGVIGLLINVYSLTRRSDQALRGIIGVGFGVWMVNNLLLAAYSAAALCGVAMTRQAVAVYVVEKVRVRSKVALCLFFVLLVLGFSAYTWQGWGTVFACVSSLFSTVAMFFFKGARLRLTVAFAYALWGCATICYQAWWALGANVLLTTAAFWGYWQLARPVERDAPLASPPTNLG
ncbi:MAG: YgjV family protein [Agitococcus sp.]|nr:YgjV family protein [Agitococcus sp.]MDO9177099.1 YgjV family protein [Agitococcus sp.]